MGCIVYGSLTLCNVFKCGYEKACDYKVIINRKTFSQYIHGTTVVIYSSVELQFKIINMLNTEYDPCMSSLISHLSFADTVFKFKLTLDHLKRCLSTEHLH